MRQKSVFTAAMFGAVVAWSLAGQAVPGVAAEGETIDVFSREMARFRSMLSSPVPQRRLQAIQGLAYLKDPSREDDLLRFLEDPSVDVRREAAVAIGQCGTARSIPGLISRLDDPKWEVRVQVYDALCRMTARAFDKDDTDAWETWWRSINPADMERVLLDELASEHVDARLRSLRALRFLGSQSAEDALLSFVRKGRTTAERRLAILALERIGTPKAIPYLAGQWLKPEAAWALGRIGGHDAEEGLLATMARDIPSWQWQTIGDSLIINLDPLESTAGDRVLPRLILQYGLITDNIRYEDLTVPPTPTQRAITNLIRRSGFLEHTDTAVARISRAGGGTPGRRKRAVSPRGTGDGSPIIPRCPARGCCGTGHHRLTGFHSSAGTSRKGWYCLADQGSGPRNH